MGVKRPHEDDSKKSSKKFKKGFQIGPANLPDGTHRRKGLCFYSKTCCISSLHILTYN
jgi:hypothetical protein